MAKDNRVSLPSSGSGITQYASDYSSKLQLKPAHVIVLIILSILLVLFLHVQGKGLFGI